MADTRIVTGVATRVGYPSARFLFVLIILASSAVGAADVLNPSFEATYDGLPWPRLLPSQWWHVDHPSFNSYSSDLWSTDGARSAALFNRIGKTIRSGDYQSFYGFVDLTGINRIEFDACLAVHPEGAFGHFEASLLIDGMPVWSSSAEGSHLDQQVCVADLPGWHCIEIRNTAVDAGVFDAAYWTLWDNFRLLEGPAVVPAAIELNPGTLNPKSNGKWITCYIELEEGYNVGMIDGATVTLNNVPAVTDKQGWAAPLANEENVADFDSDGVFERMVKFERAAVQATVKPPEATVTVSGRLTDGTSFEGAATLRVLDKDVKGK